MKKLDPEEKKRRQDARDRSRLAKFAEQAFEFTRNGHAERFAFEMFRKGLLERRSEVYSVSAGARTVEYRWAYRLSPEGLAFVGEAT